MKITFLGAAGHVTGSCSLVESGRSRVVVDCGLVQGDDEAAEKNAEPFPFSPAGIDAVVLTHGHLDHVGRLPYLVQQGFSGPVYAQAATVELAEVVLRDSARLASHQEKPLYDEAAVDATMKLMRPLRYLQEQQLEGLRLRFFEAGHILGSAHAWLEDGRRRVLFSGDIGQPNTPIIRDPTSDWPGPVDLVVIESTYGDRLHRSRQETLAEFERIVVRAVEQGGFVLIPAFAIGRTQEILYHFNHLVDRGRIPRIPVLLDSPMAERVTEIYRRHRELYDSETLAGLRQGDPPMRFPGLREVVSADESKAIKSMSPPAVIIAGSGMCSGGRIMHHLINFLPLRSTTVMIVGWQGYGTLGRRLVDGAERVKIYGQEVEVRARVETLGGFSAHGDREVLLAWARSWPEPEPVFWVNHGEPEAARALAAGLHQHGLRAHLAEEGKTASV